MSLSTLIRISMLSNSGGWHNLQGLSLVSGHVSSTAARDRIQMIFCEDFRRHEHFARSSPFLAPGNMYGYSSVITPSRGTETQ